MIIRHFGFVRAVVATAAAVAVVSGCASPAPAVESAPPTAGPSPTPTAAAPAALEPDAAALLEISGTVADQQGQSLAIALTTTSVRTPTDDDRADYAATRCAAEYPDTDPFASPDTRVVTIAVEATGSVGFSGWTDERGVLVSGSLFDGPIWEPESHGASLCYQDSRITRPGQGEVRLFTSSTDWNVGGPVAGDGSITLAVYGFQAQAIDALGRPTGVGAVADCATSASAEFDALAAEVAPGRWGKQQNLPEYCFYGRNAGD
jgi:hypothetical protein